MKSTQEILTEISTLTRKIESDYPELQKYLSETRSTLPKGSMNAKLDNKDLENYLNELQELVKKYDSN